MGEIEARGASLLAIGTGDARYARAFIEQEQVPFPVLLDEDGAAAHAAAVRRGGPIALVGPRSIAVGARAFLRGHRQRKTGHRPAQLGATFVIGPGDRLHYAHLDKDTTDHAPIDEILAALDQARG